MKTKPIPNLKMIACVDNNLGLGLNNDLLVKIPNDLKRFKELTTDSIIIMGRKTYESLPVKPLPNRVNVILTSSKTPIEGCETFNSTKAIRKYLKKQKHSSAYIIGGESVYKQFLPYVEEINLTVVNAEYEADTHFPDLFDEGWKPVQTSNSMYHDGVEYRFVDFRRR